MKMSKQFFKIVKNMKIEFLYLPTPSNISIMWNMGSILGICLMTQIISGFFLSMHYCPNTEKAFMSVIHMIQDVNNGWIMRNIHMNGASMYFIFMYLHMFRGLYYNSFKFINTWNVGVMIMLLSMATAFLGYVLPWGQMSMWGATVITNLMSAIPYMGMPIVEWLWGGFTVNNATLNRFYSLHFILPLLIMLLVLIHLMFLHKTGSSNPSGCSSNLNKIPFHPYFTIKDFVGFFLMAYILMTISTMNPYMLSDPDNFIPADSMVTPIHIQPEWYFLFAYAILRSIPNKLGGVIALMMSIMILYSLPLTQNYKMKTLVFYPITQYFYWMFITSFIILTWTGSKPIEQPFVMISQLMSLMYFMYFIIMPMLNRWWDYMLKM